jgi:phosphoribosylformylglycinamidine cyclo-ligase
VCSSDLAEIDTTSWNQGEVFDWLEKQGGIAIDEMRRTFNCGVGMAVVVDAGVADRAIALLSDCGENAWRMGTVKAGAGEVQFI